MSKEHEEIVYCNECRYSKLENEAGTCHRYPPLENGFPKIKATDFCSKGKPPKEIEVDYNEVLEKRGLYDLGKED